MNPYDDETTQNKAPEDEVLGLVRKLLDADAALLSAKRRREEASAEMEKLYEVTRQMRDEVASRLGINDNAAAKMPDLSVMKRAY